jgi:hypothetical protein
MKRKLYLRFVSAISLMAILSCDSQPEPVGDRVPEGFYPGLRVGTPLSEVRKAYPNLRFQPYYGFVADTPSAPKLFDRFGVQVSTPVSDLPPSMHDRVSTVHLFSNSGKHSHCCRARYHPSLESITSHRLWREVKAHSSVALGSYEPGFRCAPQPSYG